MNSERRYFPSRSELYAGDGCNFEQLQAAVFTFLFWWQYVPSKTFEQVQDNVHCRVSSP